MAIEPRHTAARGLVKFNNAIGWVLVVSIILLPLGLLLLIQGHLALALFETEENTRAQLEVLQQATSRLKA